MPRVGLAVATAALVLLAGCEKPGPAMPTRYLLDPLDPLLMPVTDPATPMEGEAIRSWATAPWDGSWLPYGGHAVLDIDHGLGREPVGVLVYISFTQDGRAPGLAAGDLAQIIAVDETHVVVWNNTNGHYFARVVVF